ncbi:Deaminated glutathione amidase [Gammaproteobacteria bacterium]
MSRVAAIQMASGPNISANLLEAGRLIAQAAADGAKLIVLPEDFALIGFDQDRMKAREVDGKGPIQDFLAQHSARHGVWIVGGTVPLVANASDKIRAACLVYDATGQRVARYDKIHLFDVYLEETGEKYTESLTIEPGTSTLVIDTPFGRMGLAVCYDLRFPELLREMLDRRFEIVALPAAFTAITGKAHWESLVRARAIENLCYVVAAAQGGYHLNGRETHGDSMIVDPWGVILDRLARGSGVVSATINQKRLLSIRRNFPTIEHIRLHCAIDTSTYT